MSAVWGRVEWEALADRLIRGVDQHRSPSGSLVLLPGPLAPQQGTTPLRGRLRSAQRAAEIRLGRPHALAIRHMNGLEGFARTSLLVAYRAKHAPDHYRSGLIDTVRRGLLAGTDPRHPEHWPFITSRSQAVVEAAILALVLNETRPFLWSKLSPSEKEQVATWLRPAISAEVVDNNWHLFPVTVEAFLRSAGMADERKTSTDHLLRVEQFYRGDGWYSDGGSKNFDYYNGWGFHFYLLQQAEMLGDHLALERHRARLAEFVEFAWHAISTQGAPVYFGRSMTYRHAVLAPLWLAGMHGVGPRSPRELRTAASQVANYFSDQGVPDQRDLLRLGWTQGSSTDIQTYSGAASPYWASKGFLGLAAPSTHALWSDELDTDNPPPRREIVHARPSALILHGATDSDGVRMVNHGSHHQVAVGELQPHDPLYDAFAYSSLTHPPRPGSRVANQLVVKVHGQTSQLRTNFAAVGAGPEWASSVHTVPGRRVITTSVVRGDWEIRWHHFTSEGSSGPFEATGGGYPLASPSAAYVDPGSKTAEYRRQDGTVSLIQGLHGWTSAHAPLRRGVRPFRDATAPYLQCSLGETTDLVAIISVTRNHRPPHTVSPSAQLDGLSALFTFPDGHTVDICLKPSWLSVDIREDR